MTNSMNRLWLVFVWLLTGLPALRADNPCDHGAELAIEAMDRVTEVIVHDIFTPPVSSRIYAYTSISAYTAYEWAAGGSGFTANLNDFPALAVPEQKACPEAVMLVATFTTARALLFSEDKVNGHLEEMLSSYFGSLSPVELQLAREQGEYIGETINAWAATDGYSRTRGLERYSLLEKDWAWEPTPPDHMDPIEPYWNRIRPFVLDSASTCRPPAPTPYDSVPDSPFYKEALEVYEISKQLTEDQQATVWFWDDNPFVTVHEGHLVYARKKVSPAGHWMGITSIAIAGKEASLEEALKAYALVSVALADAFISCWDEKYRSNLIRPVTYINRHIDATWEPYLQTPPFPEYTSGHSVISASASAMLTELFGDGFGYTDSVETLYGLEPRRFNSFNDAAEEAAYSRLFGGIHYRPGIEVGVLQGKQVARTIIDKLL
jgi:hypothetical protein